MRDMFSRSGSLTTHMRTHSLTTHMRTHAGETPHVCETCGKGWYRLDACEEVVVCPVRNLRTYLRLIDFKEGSYVRFIGSGSYLRLIDFKEEEYRLDACEEVVVCPVRNLRTGRFLVQVVCVCV